MANRSNRLRAALLGASALVSAAALVAASPAAAEERQFDFNIPAQPLTVALKTYGATADQQLIFSENLVRGRTAPPLKGAYTADQGLTMLLAGTGLLADRTPSGVVTIRSASDPQSGSAAGGGAEVEALIVTAQKREENIQDVPIAMSAFSQEDLTRSQIAGGPDLMTQVPNMTFTKTNFSSYSIQIRGIGTQAVSATTDAAVAVAFNNTPFIRNRFFEQEFYDLQRVEVLRGPQGTLYGRNATAGVVNILSAKPSFNYEARLSADLANYKSTRLEGMVNIPLAEDKAALRLAGAWTKRDGFVTNEISGNPIDGRNLWSGRLSLRIAPTDRLEANLIWEHFEENDDRLRSGKQLCHRDVVTEIGGASVDYGVGFGGITGAQAQLSQGCIAASLYSPDSFEAPNGLSLPYYQALGYLGLPVIPDLDPYLSTTQSHDLRTIESTVDPIYRAKSDIRELQLHFDLTPSLTLSSETGYATDDVFSLEDYNRFNTRPGVFGPVRPGDFGYRVNLDEDGTFCDPQVGCADRLVAVDVSSAISRQFSQEFRLSSDYGGNFNFNLGANFLRYDTEDKYYVFINTLTLFAAKPSFTLVSMPPWVPGVSDNHECLLQGPIEPNVTETQSVAGCIYIDPNPIGSLNDRGHNYFLSRNPYKLISYAVFGEAYYNLTEALKLTAGLRFTVDRKQAPRIPSWLLAVKTAGLPVAEVIKQEWREPTGRLALDWKPDLSFTDETLLYASYAHGYKAGGSNPPAAGVITYGGDLAPLKESHAHPKTFEPEFVNAFELGAKNTLADGRLTLNANAFYYDYTGYQISQIVDRSASNMNFDAEVWGLEFESDWTPLENLRLGLKVGYENTRVADGSKAIDLMDRTAGHEGWSVARPHPTQTSNCILPTYALVQDGQFRGTWLYVTTGSLSGCEYAYLFGMDPVTQAPYVPNPTPNDIIIFPGYIGFDPTTAPNNGEGFDKDLGGNELPNAPHFTATLTADYTLPLPNDWLLTLHGDLYGQSEAWTRIFNMPGYDKIKAYNNLNLAAIFTNEDAGWKVMAYVKNVFDKDSITGAFLNSDDTGLTTNVFLTEPRLYGLRVTKEWNGGGAWWTGANSNHQPGAPWPLTVEVGAQIQHWKAPYQTLQPSFGDQFVGPDNTIDAVQHDLDWGDGLNVKATYRPQGSPWRLAADVRFGRTNGDAKRHGEEAHETVCWLIRNEDGSCGPTPYFSSTPTDVSDSSASNGEKFEVVDFALGHDVGFGGLESSVSLGLRYARFTSRSELQTAGIPDMVVPELFFNTKYEGHHHWDVASIDARRKFTGVGPIVSWDASRRLVGDDTAGHLDAEWSVGGGVMFGKQQTTVTGTEDSSYYIADTLSMLSNSATPPAYVAPTRHTNSRRDRSVGAPVANLSLGLSYEVQRSKLSTGYRWERYFDTIDAGFETRQSSDRTIDGPYFKIAVGFGG